ncbi:MAG: CHAT domain-containing protein [bacterium]|nr:CHAT domain-containing protein [bacterium]
MPSSEYLDCELHLTAYDQAGLSVAGRDYEGRPVLDEAIERRLLEADLDPTRYGTELFEALFPGEGDDLLAGYREGLAIARHEEKRLRFRLHIATKAPATLHELHWEFLWDPKERIALGRSRETAFSRYLSVPLEPAAALTERPRLLVVLSTPTNLADYKLPVIDRDALRESLDKALGPLHDLVSYEFLKEPATVGRIRERLVADEFHALHLQAHGLLRPDRSTAHLVLEDEDRRAAFIAEDLFSEIFEGERCLRFIALVACHSGVQPGADPFSGLGPGLVRRGIPALIAMRRAISVDAAAQFAEHLYRNLARSGRLDEAANEARQQLYLADPESLEWGTPALFMRLQDAQLWRVDAGAERVTRRRSRAADSEVGWPALLTRIGSGKFVPILGPGLYRGWLPSAQEIAARWAAEYNCPLDGHSTLPCVAQFVETKEGPGYPHDILPQNLVDELLEREGVNERGRLSHLSLTEVIERIADRHFDRDENEPHRILAELPISTYVTTNYDSFMSAALRWVGRTPRREYCNWRVKPEDDPAIDDYKNLQGTPEDPLIFHLYGNDLEPTSQVLTEDDYFDFFRAIAADFDIRIPLELQASLSESMLLFLGYEVRNLDCRVLFRGLVAQLRDMRRGRRAVLQLQGDENDSERVAELKNFINRCCDDLHVKVYWGSVREFLTELRDRWRAEHGGA